MKQGYFEVDFENLYVHYQNYNASAIDSSPLPCLKISSLIARVAELVDALDLGSSGFAVGVRVSPLAPKIFVTITGENALVQTKQCNRSKASAL